MELRDSGDYLGATTAIVKLNSEDALDGYKTLEARSLPILTTTEKAFQINVEAFKTVLDKVGDRQFVFYSINGPSRSGKSYILNYFIKYFEFKKLNGDGSNWVNFKLDSEFPSRSGRERNTLGMHLWSEPYFIQAGEGEELAVILMDTQGLFDEHTTALHNAFIMSISTLCSSVMIFNVMRLITEDILQQLQQYSSYASTVTVHEMENNSSSGKSQSFQDLLFLVRDFELPEYEFGIHSKTKVPQGSLKNYFRDTFCLEEKQGANFPVENILVRQSILNNFNKVSVFPFPDPGKKFKTQTEGGALPPDDEFQEHAVKFVEMLLSDENIVRKTVGGWEVTGKEFLQHVTTWAQLCQEAKDSFPDIRTITETTALTQYSTAECISFTSYKKEMDKYMTDQPNGSQKNLVIAHNVANRRAIALFNKHRKLVHELFNMEFQGLLNQHIAAYYEKLNVLNEKRREYTRIKSKLQNIETIVSKKMKDLDKSFDQLKNDDPSKDDLGAQIRTNPDLIRMKAEMCDLKEHSRRLAQDSKNMEQTLNAPQKPNTEGGFCVIC